MTNIFKGLDLVDRVPEELWTEVCNIVQEAVIETIPKKKKCKEAKCLSEETLQIAEEKGNRKQERKVQFSSVARSCPTLCDPMNCSTPGLPVHHQLPESTQAYVH